MKDNKLKTAIAENPVTVLFLGACPAMGASAAVIPALGMAGAVIAVMLLSAIIISLLRRLIPAGVRIPACILIVAGVTSVVQLFMNALLGNVYQMLGVYLAVAAVDLMVFSGTGDAGEHGFGFALRSSLLTSLSFAAVILAVAAVREVLGSGSFAGIDLPFFASYNVPLLTKASGGFLVFAIALAVVAAIRPAADKKAGGFAGAAALLCRVPGRTEEE